MKWFLLSFHSAFKVKTFSNKTDMFHLAVFSKSLTIYIRKHAITSYENPKKLTI